MASPVPEVVVGLADRAVLVRPEVVAALARLLVLVQLVLLPELSVLSPLPLPVQLEVVVHLARLPVLALLEVAAEPAVEEAPLCRSFSAAMVGNLPSAGTPRYSPVPRSGRKAKRRP